MTRELKVETVVATAHKLGKLNTQETPLRQHSSMLLDSVAEAALHLFIRKDDSLAEKRTHLCASDVECIT